MNKNKFSINLFLAFVFSTVCFIVLKEFISPVFTLIDDNIMEEIISGTFTGSPDGHAIYIKYTLAYFLSRLYYLNASISWYGIFLIGCEALSIFFVIYRICSNTHKISMKILFSIAFIMFFSACTLNGFVFFTYTSVAGLLGACAIFWFLTIPEKSTKTILIINYTIFIVLFVTGFSIRSNVIIMISPILLLAIIYKFNNHLFKRYLLLGLAVLISVSAIIAIEKIAYSSKQWKNYLEYNDARTVAYETKGVLDYQTNQEIFRDLEISKELHKAYIGYYFNFGNSLDSNSLIELSKINKHGELNFASKLVTVLFNDNYKITTCVFLFIYLIILIFLLFKKQWKLVLYLISLLFLICLPWFYMIYVKKIVFRVGISCFFVGILFILALLINNKTLFNFNIKTKRITYTLILISILFGLYLQITSTKNEFDKGYYSLSSNEREEIKSWCKLNPENIYFITNNMYVDFGTNIDKNISTINNCTSLGMGWIAHAPLVDEKLIKFGLENLETDLIEKSNTYIITYHDDEMKIILDYYLSEYPNFKYSIYETFTTSNGGKYDVYKFN